MIPPVALILVSAAILAYEVLLVRLFAIVQWHHFAFMAISIALLGFGVAGTVIVLLGNRAVRATRPFFNVAAAMFAATAPAGFLVAQHVPFNPLEVVWAPGKLLWLGLIYLLLAVPFTAGALCIGLAFRAPGAVAGRVYLWNLLGSGAGAAGVVGALFVLPPAGGLVLVGALGLGAAVTAAPRARRALWRGGLSGLAVLALAGVWLAPAGWTALRLSEFKDLPRALAVDGATLLAERSGPLALLSVVASPGVPFRHAPGLSLFAPALPPEQLGVFADGGFAGAIDLWDGEIGALAYLDHAPDAAAHHLSGPQRVLVLEAGGGRLVLQALAHGAPEIAAVESDANMVALLVEDFAGTSGRLGDRADLWIAVAEARHFLDAGEGGWDLIQLPPLGAGASAPARGLSENFLFTAEGLARAYDRLSPGGWLSATIELDLPPRATFKLATTLRAGLADAGVADPASQVVALRSLTTMTVLARRGPVTQTEIAALDRFAEARGFDLVYYPGMPRSQANRRIRLDQPVYRDGLAALLGPGHADFVDRYQFDIRAATDNRPYVHDVFRWAALPELLALGPAAGAALLELGELIVTATLAQAVVLAAILVLLPLRLKLSGRLSGSVVRRYGLYFTALGLAFLFIEIAWIQRFVQFLGHPLYAVSVGLTGFLVFAGLGAGASVVLDRRLTGRRISAPGLAIGGIVIVAGSYLAALPGLLDAMSGWPAALRVAAALGLIGPLAFFMGMPFPLGLSRLAMADKNFVPWAWGLNGCASVVSAAAATLISMNAGISATILVGIALYAAALAVLPKTAR